MSFASEKNQLLAENTQLLFKAAAYGNLNEVRRLIPLSEPKSGYSYGLRIAAEYGHTQCVELLIPVSEPKADDSRALRIAAQYGHTQCVELLIPVSNPKDLKSHALRLAVENGHEKCAELLYPVSDLVEALKRLQKYFPHNFSMWGQLQQVVEAEQLNKVLHQEIGEITGVKVQRKM